MDDPVKTEGGEAQPGATGTGETGTGPTQGRDSVLLGAALAVVWHVLVLAVCGLFATVVPGEAGAFLFLYPLLLIGATQFLYLPVLAIRRRRRGLPESAKGVWIVLGLTFLLNAGCWGLVAAAL